MDSTIKKASPFKSLLKSNLHWLTRCGTTFWYRQMTWRIRVFSRITSAVSATAEHKKTKSIKCFCWSFLIRIKQIFNVNVITRNLFCIIRLFSTLLSFGLFVFTLRLVLLAQRLPLWHDARHIGQNLGWSRKCENLSCLNGVSLIFVGIKVAFF